MTKNKDVKKLIRERAAKTGEKYSAARAQFLRTAGGAPAGDGRDGLGVLAHCIESVGWVVNYGWPDFDGSLDAEVADVIFDACFGEATQKHKDLARRQWSKVVEAALRIDRRACLDAAQGMQRTLAYEGWRPAPQRIDADFDVEVRQLADQEVTLSDGRTVTFDQESRYVVRGPFDNNVNAGRPCRVLWADHSFPRFLWIEFEDNHRYAVVEIDELESAEETKKPR